MEFPKEALERELHGMDTELSVLRQQQAVVAARISKLEKDRFALDCKIRSIEQQQLPL